MEAAAAPGQSFGRLGGDILRIEAIAGAGFRLELRPELAEGEALGHAAPKVFEAQSQRKRLRHGLSGGWGRSRHRLEILIIEEERIEEFGEGEYLDGRINPLLRTT